MSAGSTSVFSDVGLPGLTAGDYQIIVTQHVQIDETAGASGTDDQTFAAVNLFRVDGPHLALGPTDVVACAPPSGAQGDFGTTLPHVLLGSPTLPWQIPLSDVPGPPTPWLALLVLTADDLAGPVAPGGTGATTVTVQELLDPPSDVRGPDPTAALSDLTDTDTTTCVVVDVTASAFTAIAPSRTDMTYLAHARQITGNDDIDLAAPGAYASIIANRLPVVAGDGRYICHLVSLEGFADYLPGGSASPVDRATVRLLSLYSWSFRSMAGSGDFAGLMEDLDVGALTGPLPAGVDAPLDDRVRTALAAGYVGLRYLTRLGEETVGWYRGPFLPVPLDANPQPAYPAATAALLYDLDTGMFDTSYAVAWEIGRLLTLAQPTLAQSLNDAASTVLNAARRALADQRAGAVVSGRSRPPARIGATQRAVARIRPVLPGPARRGAVLGRRCDPGRLDHTRLPGLLDDAALRELQGSVGDPASAVVAAVVGPARRPADARSGDHPTPDVLLPKAEEAHHVHD